MFKWLEKNLPKIVMAPAVGLIGWFVYGFVLWTLYISFTNSKILPKYELWGFGQYEKLWASRKWLISVDNLLVFTALFLIFCIVIGIILAIFLDQKIRNSAVKTNKLSTEISHFLDAHNFSYCPNPHNSYLGNILEFVKDIYKVQRTNP